MSAENEIRNIKLFEEEIRNIKQMAFDAAHPVNETYTQYPQQDDPMTLYNKDGVTSVWEIQSQYSGAFFRSSNAPEAVYKADDEDEYYIRDAITGGLIAINASADGGPSISPTPSGESIIIEGKEYKRYPVTVSSRNAADYINKTNSLSIQSNQNLSHNHGGTTGNTQPTFSGTSRTLALITGSSWRNITQSNITYSAATTSTGGGIVTNVDYQDTIRYYKWTDSGSVQNHHHSISYDGGDECRPDNFTQIIWKRIS